jgi:redox-sensitive bicupin YhaK (pirin superfamily)
MKTNLYKAETRGHADHGWLDTHHTFSFANYYNPERIHFGALRVLNDDIVQGGEGFGRHPHDNMEIISIPLKGSLRHGDSMGNGGVINAGDVQVMSAGTGVFHSEFNADKNEEVNFFQIWVFPNKKGVEPRYEQKQMDFLQHKNELCEIVTPEPTDHSLWIHQDAWFNIGSFDGGEEAEYTLKNPKNGVFAMVIQGGFDVAGTELDRRDGIGIWDAGKIKFKSLGDDSRILLIEVPMEW